MADIEKAMRLAYGPDWREDGLHHDDHERTTAQSSWESALAWISEDPTYEAAFHEAILALALCEPGTTKLGRWEVMILTDWIWFESVAPGPDTSAAGDTQAASSSSASWFVRLAPGSYLDGTAQELLLLMAAADELRRRMEAENG